MTKRKKFYAIKEFDDVSIFDSPAIELVPYFGSSGVVLSWVPRRGELDCRYVTTVCLKGFEDALGAKVKEGEIICFELREVPFDDD